MAGGHADTFHHVRDWTYFELPHTLGLGQPIYDAHGDQIAYGIPLPEILGLQLTRFMVLQVVAGLLVLLVFWGLSRKVRGGAPVRGAWWNFWETLALYIRDQVVRPAIGTGHHDPSHAQGHAADDAGYYDPGTGHGPYDSIGTREGDTDAALRGHAVPSHGGAAVATVAHPADKYLPFIWTVFFYILFCNLLGAVPILGAPMGHIAVTGALAAVTFAYVVICGSRELGVAGFWKSIAPSMDIPGFLGPIIKVMIWVIEFAGLLIKHGVLAVRLFANILAGHTVLAMILAFIATVAHPAMADWLWWAVTPASIAGQVFIGLLELLVAFIQAYVFALLAALFVGMAVHPH